MTTFIGTVSPCARVLRRWRLVFGAAVLLAASLVAASASAELILADFGALPSSSLGPYELVWTAGTTTGGTLSAGTGASSSGDGGLGLGSQTASGLVVQTAYLLTGGTVAGEVFSGSSTLFYDASLVLTGLTANVPATPTILGTRTLLSQPLTNGTFAFYGTDKTTLLLGGTIDDALITGYQNYKTGAVLSISVTYTGGKILDAVPASSRAGEFSWDILGLTVPLTTNASGYLKSFDANATGQFSVADPVPEPGTLMLLGIGGLGLAGFVYRRRRST
jgi:hypothetical protein